MSRPLVGVWVAWTVLAACRRGASQTVDPGQGVFGAPGEDDTQDALGPSHRRQAQPLLLSPAARSHSCRALPMRGSSPVTNPVNNLRGRPAGLTVPSAGCLLRPQSALQPGPCPASVGPSRLRPGSGPPSIWAACRLGPTSRRGCRVVCGQSSVQCSALWKGPGWRPLSLGARPPASVRGAPGLGVGTARSPGPLGAPAAQAPWEDPVGRDREPGPEPWTGQPGPQHQTVSLAVSARLHACG